MKIAIVSDAIFPYHKGGKETRIFELSTRLAQAGHEVDIYTMKWWDEPSKLRRENGVVLHAISPKWDLYAHGRRSMVQGIGFGLLSFRLMLADFDVADVDHMPYFPLFSMKIVCMLRRKPMVATWHEVWGRDYWRQYLGRLGWIAAALEQMTVRMPNRIVAVSELTEDRLTAVLHAAKPIRLVENGIDTAAIRRLSPAATQTDLVTVGRLLGHKNIDMFVRSVAIVAKKRPNIRAIVIGDGPERASLEKLANQLGVAKNFTFTGYVESEIDKFRLLKASRVFVHPTTREGFGIVALEALACGLPVVTTNHSDNAARYLVSDSVGRICAPNAKAIASAIESVLCDQELADTTEYAKAYDWTTSAQAISEVYAS